MQLCNLSRKPIQIKLYNAGMQTLPFIRPAAAIVISDLQLPTNLQINLIPILIPTPTVCET